MSISLELRTRGEHGAVLAGMLTLPEAPGVWPAVVAVHGASRGTRDSPLLQPLASILPRHGVGTLLFDRRGKGASTGWPPDTSFEDLAADVRSWVEYLRRHPGAH